MLRPPTPLFCGVAATDVSILRCYGHRCLNFAVLRPPMPPFCGVTATDAFILRCYGHRRLHFAVLRPPMPPFCGVTATDASILRCCGHRYLNFAVLRPPMPSFCCVTATDASILRCSCPCLVVTHVAVHGRRISRQASGKHSLSPVPPTIYHSGMLCRKQAVSIRPVPQASQNNSIRSLSLRDLALINWHRRMLYVVCCMSPRD